MSQLVSSSLSFCRWFKMCAFQLNHDENRIIIIMMMMNDDDSLKLVRTNEAIVWMCIAIFPLCFRAMEFHTEATEYWPLSSYRLQLFYFYSIFVCRSIKRRTQSAKWDGRSIIDAYIAEMIDILVYSWLPSIQFPFFSSRFYIYPFAMHIQQTIVQKTCFYFDRQNGMNRAIRSWNDRTRSYEICVHSHSIVNRIELNWLARPSLSLSLSVSVRICFRIY